MNLNKSKEYAPLVLRLFLSIVFLWFAISQFSNLQTWTGLVPEYFLNFAPATFFVFLNALIDLTIGLFLVVGLFIRPISFVGSLHLISIISMMGYNPIAVRDFGLLGAMITLFLLGPDKFSLDEKIRKN